MIHKLFVIKKWISAPIEHLYDQKLFEKCFSAMSDLTIFVMILRSVTVRPP